MSDLELRFKQGIKYCKAVNITPLPIDGERTIAFLSKISDRDDSGFEAPAYAQGLSFISAICKY